MWTSKLGGKFPRSDIERLDAQHHRELKRLRSLPANARCAECCEPDTCWTSVNLGLFLCTRCSDVHRALGTHISKVKGCSGTYLWGPDEIARMQELGNDAAKRRYGPAPVPAANASKDERVRLCREKYEQLRWAGEAAPEAPLARKLPQPERAAPRSTPQVPVPQSVTALAPKVQQAPFDFDIDAIFEALHGEKPAPAQPILALEAALAPQRPLEDFLDQCLELAPAAKAAPPSTMPDFWADFGEW